MTEEIDANGIRGSLHIPEAPSGDGVVLTHGAGGNHGMPLLVSVADALAQAGFTVLRCDLPFRQKRPHGPPHPSGAAADRSGLKQALDSMRERAKGRVLAGGQSYGGRQASMLAAEDPASVDGLLLLSYPLHPPGKPDRARTAHFPGIQCPVLFVHGSGDLFATFEELTAAMSLIPAKSELSEVLHAGHDLARGKFDMNSRVVSPLLKLIS